MPTYQYDCVKCGHKFEAQRKMTESDKELKCPKCGAAHPRRDYCGCNLSSSGVSSCSVEKKRASYSGG